MQHNSTGSLSKESQIIDLVKKKNEIEAAIKKTKKTLRKDARKKIISLATEFDISLEKLFKTAAEQVLPKYRHPENHQLTWSGRGLMPKWMKELIANGRSKEEFLIGK